MAWPNTKEFGISDNPLINSPFIETTRGGSSHPVFNLFLLMNANSLLLMNGNNLSLSG